MGLRCSLLVASQRSKNVVFVSVSQGMYLVCVHVFPLAAAVCRGAQAGEPGQVNILPQRVPLFLFFLISDRCLSSGWPAAAVLFVHAFIHKLTCMFGCVYLINSRFLFPSCWSFKISHLCPSRTCWHCHCYTFCLNNDTSPLAMNNIHPPSTPTSSCAQGSRGFLEPVPAGIWKRQGNTLDKSMSEV